MRLAMVLLSLAFGAEAANWAVIMAGSNGYMNYRHQADACHAYQVARQKGTPESNIILLAYDDIANNTENPFPGKIFNSPAGIDVYAGCKIDYKGQDVTAPGPVLQSTADDRVFVFYTDHGGTGILGVPDGVSGGDIHAVALNNALQQMQAKGLYKELLFYVEACFAGSMFKDLLKAPNAVVVTASNSQESSWGTYCGPNDVVHGKELFTCLGDLFSISWMEDADASDLKTEAVKEQVRRATLRTNKSHVTVFGDMAAIGEEPASNFEGSASLADAAPRTPDTARTDVSAWDVDIYFASYAVQRAASAQEKKKAEDMLAYLFAQRAATDARFLEIAVYVTEDAAVAHEFVSAGVESLEEAVCHQETYEAVIAHCGRLDSYAMRYSSLLASLCNARYSVQAIVAGVEQVCSSKEALYV
eukprot:NODE_6908_length_1626_cov_10.047365.p1 GENE.NODE_6908_length_1626_cov_10.047365~~NODE_6908_length_1626_cov_10.047365.p1  ORF type:complete len:417 (+),score=107.72 NODE_6908_length_1626_cov_10.047365:106-1356(+)